MQNKTDILSQSFYFVVIWYIVWRWKNMEFVWRIKYMMLLTEHLQTVCLLIILHGFSCTCVCYYTVADHTVVVVVVLHIAIHGF